MFMSNETVLSVQDGKCPLHIATVKCHTVIVNVLIKCGVNVNTMDNVSNW